MIGVISAGVLLWFWLLLPETLHPIYRMPLSFRRLAGGWRMTITDRWSLGYTLSSTAFFGPLYCFITSVHLIVFVVIGRSHFFTPLPYSLFFFLLLLSIIYFFFF